MSLESRSRSNFKVTKTNEAARKKQAGGLLLEGRAKTDP